MEEFNLTEEQLAFIDNYLETMESAHSAEKAGYPRKDSAKIALELLANETIQKAIEARREQLNSLTINSKFTKEDLLRVFWNMYNEARRKGKVAEAKSILEDIARWNGVEPDKVKTEIAVLKFNLDGDKI